MVADVANQIDMSGDTILAKDIILGLAAGTGLQGSSAASILNQASLAKVIKNVNFNVGTTDTAVTIPVPTGLKNYVVDSVYIVNATHTLVTATVGVFSAVSAGGTTIAADQAITVTSGTANTALNTQALTLSPAATIAFNYPTLYVRVGTAEGAAATADVVITAKLLN